MFYVFFKLAEKFNKICLVWIIFRNGWFMFFVFWFERILHLYIFAMGFFDQVLVSEFVLGITGGDVVLWPQDLSLQLATGVFFSHRVPFSNKRLWDAQRRDQIVLFGLPSLFSRGKLFGNCLGVGEDN